MDDWNKIADRIGALAVHIDARRWDDLLELFAPEVLADWTSLFGGEPQSLKGEQLIANWRQLLPGFTRTTHLVGPPTIVVTGESAQASASVVAWHFIKEPGLEGNDLWLAGGCYEIAFAKRDGVWRINAMTLARAWAEGNQDLPRLAGERASQSGKT
jgi:SnoaL-like domain